MGDGGEPELVRCVSCGVYLVASVEDGRTVPTRDSCVECAGTGSYDAATL